MALTPTDEAHALQIQAGTFWSSSLFPNRIVTAQQIHEINEAGSINGRHSTFEDLKLQGQGLQEAITLTSKYEELLQALVDKPDDKDLLMEFESMSPLTADLQTRFSPHLNMSGLLAAHLNSVQAKLDGDVTLIQ